MSDDQDQLTGVQEAAKRFMGRRQEDPVSTWYKQMVESAPDALVLIDSNGKIVLVNAQTEKLFGYTRKELIGAAIETLVPERYRDRHVTHRDDYLGDPQVREMGAGLDLLGVRKGGDEFPVEISLSPLHTDKGIYATAAIRDVTERKDVERKIAAYARNLERSNRELEQFAYVASHDLQAPLRNIASFAKLLKREVDGKISPESDEYFGFIEDSAKQMQALISDILQLSRVSRVDREPTIVSLETVVAQAAKQLQVTITERNAQITFKQLPEVWGDEPLLVQVFQNLIGNGMKFQKPDVVPHVEISVAQAPHNHWRIEIADNGIGIKDEHQERIFEIFQRLHTHEQYPGTGIGLSLCKKIIEENHGGEIGVKSQVDVGTVFWFTLPADEMSKGNIHV